MSEISELLADVRENLVFLRELGVDGIAAELPDFDLSRFAAPVAAPISKAPAPPQRLPEIAKASPPVERFIPDTNFVKNVPPPAVKPTPSEKPASRLGLLSSSKLSGIPARAAVKAAENENLSSGKNAPQVKQEPMPMEKTAEQSPVAALFTDITRDLPVTGETLDGIRAEIGNCTRCPLHEGRTQVVHSTGNRQAELMFIGEAPGADEDMKGEPFVGRAGQLLTKIIEAIGIKREEVFIGNINRCRPPGNRQPTLPEAHSCKPFLLREIAVVRPKVIVLLGNTACHNLLETKIGITKIRGIFQDYYGVKVMPTFHPAYLLRDPSKKRETWEDMKKVRDYLTSIKG